MKRALVIVAVILTMSNLTAQEKNFIDQNYIEISARAEKEVAPDEIYLNITIKEQDNKSRSLEKQERELFKRLLAIGVDLEKNMQIQDISTMLQKYLLRKDAVLTSKSYLLKVNSTELLVKVFKVMEELDIPDVTVARTALSNTDEVRREVMASAAESAKMSAEKLASTLGRKLGKAIYIQCYDNSPRVMKAYAGINIRGDVVAEGAFREPVLDYDKIRFDQSVIVRFSLE
jgi:hypothetical protein